MIQGYWSHDQKMALPPSARLSLNQNHLGADFAAPPRFSEGGLDAFGRLYASVWLSRVQHYDCLLPFF
jgi:hypothetical protein